MCVKNEFQYTFKNNVLVCHPFREQLDMALSVYRHILKFHQWINDKQAERLIYKAWLFLVASPDEIRNPQSVFTLIEKSDLKHGWDERSAGVAC